MSWDEVSDSVCPVARSLALIGDRWTMLILRELSMDVHRFDDLQAQTGMSSHLLTQRLKRLEQDEIIEKRLYNERPPRYEYHVTEKGQDLDPLLMMLRTWGRKWQGDVPCDEPAVTIVHKATGIVLDDLWQIPGGGRDFTFNDVEGTMGPAFAAERAQRSEAFYAEKQNKSSSASRAKPKARTAVAKKKTKPAVRAKR